MYRTSINPPSINNGSPVPDGVQPTNVFTEGGCSEVENDDTSQSENIEAITVEAKCEQDFPVPKR